MDSKSRAADRGANAAAAGLLHLVLQPMDRVDSDEEELTGDIRIDYRYRRNQLYSQLLSAFAAGQVEFVAEFLNNSPFNGLVSKARDADGYTALHRAVVLQQLEVARLLSRRATAAAPQQPREPLDPSPSPLGEWPSLRRPYDPIPMLHEKTRHGWTALHLAVCADNVEMVDLLLKWYEGFGLPADSLTVGPWDFHDKFGMTPLHYAVLGHMTGVVSLLARSKAFRKNLNDVDNFRRSALHMACANVNAAVAELLGAPDVDCNAKDCCAYTPLHWAVVQGEAEAVRPLTSRATERIIRTTEEDIQGRTVMQVAIENPTKVGRDLERLLLTMPELKDEVERLYRDRQVFVDAANAILLGAALIASVTFGGWLQPPHGHDPEVRIFWAFNSLAFFFSMATVMAGAGTVLPMSDVYIGHSVTRIRLWLALTSFLLLVSVVLVLGAFAAAGFASLQPIPKLHSNMLITTCIGSVVCGVIALLFLKRMSKIRVRDDFLLLFTGLWQTMGSTRRRSIEQLNIEQEPMSKLNYEEFDVFRLSQETSNHLPPKDFRCVQVESGNVEPPSSEGLSMCSG
ncbi:hypothetical protein Mp_4g00750 [Marchantia polymorpha subsp. ruderalis]|uniref:PGG domain-containing protein n=2 Tax=Marchantia polymorpha TaxID=3197 RepID=A0AAF6B4Z0_MARPO|nr:hypothetical protein MARPO_0066s0067 [Marchantia polymorpha]BBN07074.1 hypothetical protein Mp_4g00750 [Marchantia polymorpha subsp. ruderalis]|eukprot:PTQ36110.1 hypothetical protein MARPO_0066s0067 [Marchantia polymorpha]